MWLRLCAAFRWTAWHDDPEMAGNDGRRARAAEIAVRVREEIARRTSDELADLAVRHDLPITRVNEAGEVPAEAQIAARDIFPDADHWRPLGPAAPAVPIALADEARA